jgi:hypothetical protein
VPSPTSACRPRRLSRVAATEKIAAVVPPSFRRRRRRCGGISDGTVSRWLQQTTRRHRRRMPRHPRLRCSPRLAPLTAVVRRTTSSATFPSLRGREIGRRETMWTRKQQRRVQISQPYSGRESCCLFVLFPPPSVSVRGGGEESTCMRRPRFGALPSRNMRAETHTHTHTKQTNPQTKTNATVTYLPFFSSCQFRLL